jgi:hypothetical protein
MTTFNWTITNLERAQDDYITIVHWRCDGSVVTGQDEEGADIIESIGAYGTIGFNQEEGEEIIAFADLTEELVWGWTYEKLNKEEVEATVQAKLAEMLNPPLISGLPW